MRRREVIGTAVAAGLTALAGCGGGGGSDGGSTEDLEGTVVEVGPDGRFTFEPGTEAPLEIAVGTTVTWIWRSRNHNIVVESQPEGADWAGHEPVEDTGFTYTHTFDVAGEYHYYCQPHRSAGMTADVVVE